MKQAVDWNCILDDLKKEKYDVLIGMAIVIVESLANTGFVDVDNVEQYVKEHAHEWSNPEVLPACANIRIKDIGRKHGMYM